MVTAFHTSVTNVVKIGVPFRSSGSGNGGSHAPPNSSMRGGAAAAAAAAAAAYPPEALNKKALDIIQRVRDKLTGRDFDPKELLDVAKQVDNLILQATNNENLCQCFIGWCPFW